MCLSHPIPPIARSFAEAAEAAGVPYIGQETPQADGVTGSQEVGAGGGGCREARVGEREGKIESERRLPLPRQLQQEFGASFLTDVHTAELWEKCSVVVGMHPDEATEPIVDACLGCVRGRVRAREIESERD